MNNEGRGQFTLANKLQTPMQTDYKIIGDFMGIPPHTVNLNTKNLMAVRLELHERTDMTIKMGKNIIHILKGKREVMSTTFGQGLTEVEALTFAITVAINASAV